MARNTRNFPKDEDESLKETVRKLKSQVRRLKKDNANLKSENATLVEAWSKSEALVSQLTEDYSLEELLEEELPAVVKKKFKNIQEEPDSEAERMRLKWAKWRKENL